MIKGPVSELRHIGKTYHGRAVVEDISLAVDDGEMVAITGPSGSGKSTLLNIMGLLESPDGGELRLFGDKAPAVGSSRATRMLRSRLGYLFQNYALIDDQTVDENLQLAQAYVPARRHDRQESREAALGVVGLPGCGRRKVYELSGGEQQRVAIARLILKPCDLILADEPTGSLDPVNAAAVVTMLRDLNRRGKTVIVVSHDQRVATACDRVWSLPDLSSQGQPSAETRFSA